MPESTTVQAWVDGGASTPEATVTLGRDPDTNLAALTVTRPRGQRTITVLLDADSLDALVDAAVELATGGPVASLQPAG